MTTTKKEAENKKEFTMKQVFAMWQKKSKTGSIFFTGKNEAGERLVGFYNGKKQNPKEPDVRIYKVDEEGKAVKDAYCSLWANTSKKEKQYLTGKIENVRVVGFINSGAKVDDKRPYFSVYESEAMPQPMEEKKVEPAEAPF